jgi:putative FmdB family regulatory protein
VPDFPSNLTVLEDLVPTYQYACTDCGHRFEAVQAFTDDSLTTCPECAGKLRKVYGSVGVVFKGSGFYRTDSRAASSDVSAAKSSDKSGGEKSGGEKSGGEKSGGEKKSDAPAAKPAGGGSGSGSTSSNGSSGGTSSGSSSSSGSSGGTKAAAH